MYIRGPLLFSDGIYYFDLMKKTLLTACILSSISMFSQTIVIWSENFNDTTLLPATWTQETFATDGGWLVNDDATASSAYFQIPDADSLVLYTNDDDCDCDKSNDLVKLPAFNLVGVDNPYLVFDLFYLQATFSGYTEKIELLTSVNGGMDWDVQSTLSSAYEWQTVSVDLAEFAGGDVQVALRYNDGGGWLFGAAVDNMMLVDVDPTDVDASLSEGNIGVFINAVPTVAAHYSKYTTGSEVLPIVSITNESIAPITSFEVSYNTGGAAVTETVNSVLIGMGETYQHTFDGVVTMPSGLDTIYFNLLQVNGASDNVSENNAAQNIYEGIAPNANKRVVAEMGTGTWCGWCPRGRVYMNYLSAKYPDNFIGLAVHNADPMVVAEYDAALGNNLSGYPAGLIDRASFEGSGEMDPVDFERAMMERIADNSGIEISVAVNLLSDLDATVTANVLFTNALTATYKTAIVIIEDEVSGTGSGWAQTNYYTGGDNGPMGGFENLGEVIPASSITYSHVVRKVIGSWAGADLASISTPSADTLLSWSFNAPLNESWDVNNLRAVALLINSINGEIVNAAISDNLSVSVNELEANEMQFSIFPNPANDIVYIRLNSEIRADATIRIVDASGRLVTEQPYYSLNAESVVPINTSSFSNGLYSISVQTNDAITSKTLLVNR